jgi:L,D-transpeptidase ErfK/SrfK
MTAFSKRKFLIFFLFALVLGAIPQSMALAAYDKNYVGDMTEYRASADDTFVYLARDYNLGYVEMRAANPGVDPWVPGSGTRLILPTRHLLPDAPRKGIVINLPEMRLYHYLKPGEAPVNYPIGIGREGLDTPLGVTKIVRKVEGPVWTPTERMRREKPELPAFEPPGPNNPMGTHALYLGFPLVAIHGTNRAFGIGRRISSGCIRLYPEDIIDLYNQAPVGVQVNVVNQPIKAAWIGDELFIEAHPEVENAIALEETGVMPAPKLNQSDMERIIKTAGVYKDNIRWATVRTAIRERRGYPIMIARKTGGAVVSQTENTKEESGPETAAIPKKEIKKEAEAALKEITSEPYKPVAATADNKYLKNHAASLNR